MTNGVPLGTAKDVVYRVVSSDPSKTLKLKDGTVLRRAYLYTIQDAGQHDEFLICADTYKHNLTSVSSVNQLQHLLFGLVLNSEIEV